MCASNVMAQCLVGKRVYYVKAAPLKDLINWVICRKNNYWLIDLICRSEHFTEIIKARRLISVPVFERRSYYFRFFVCRAVVYALRDLAGKTRAKLCPLAARRQDCQTMPSSGEEARFNLGELLQSMTSQCLMVFIFSFDLTWRYICL